MVREGGIDWAMGELLAFGSLLKEGVPVRLAGQDSRRGTFVQRHAVLVDQATGEEWTPLLYLGEGQARFWRLRLAAVASTPRWASSTATRSSDPTRWCCGRRSSATSLNGAQTIIDEFISSAEQKWGQRSAVVLLLPHGYEGQGPDHSSARIERYLQMCAEDNMTVAFPSTPASYFHLLRRQAYARPRRPLIVFTPKSMLRLKAAASGVADFTRGTFRPVLPDHHAAGRRRGDPGAAVHRQGRTTTCWPSATQAGRHRTAIVRLEQLYPAAGARRSPRRSRTTRAPRLVWVQEEPANQGAWPFMALNLPQAPGRHAEGRSLQVVARPASASPATGSSKKHAAQQAALIAQAFDR